MQTHKFVIISGLEEMELGKILEDALLLSTQNVSKIGQ